jgi:hypothetical protein
MAWACGCRQRGIHAAVGISCDHVLETMTLLSSEIKRWPRPPLVRCPRKVGQALVRCPRKVGQVKVALVPSELRTRV